MIFDNEDTVTMGFMLTRNARNIPNKEAIIFEEQRLTYKQLNDNVNKVANSLIKLGVKKGDRVAMLLSNGIPMIELYWATYKIGAVIVPLNPMVKGENCAHMINDSSPKVLVVEKTYIKDMEKIKQGLNSVERFIVVGQNLSDQYLNYDEMKSQGSIDEPDCKVSMLDDCNIMYTSGTTGLPKGIVHTHEIRVWHTIVYSLEFGFTSNSVGFAAGSLVFNGMLSFLFTAIMTGGTFVFMNKYDDEKVIELIENENITHAMFVPTQLYSLLNSLNGEYQRLSSLEVILSLGAPLYEGTKKELCEKLPGRLNELYGLTEGFATILKSHDMVTKSNSVGLPAIFHEFKIVNEAMEELPVGEMGEIIGRGPSLMKGYYNNEAETNKAIYENKWLKTGDIGYRDEDGYLYLVDRKKDTIISGGINIYPNDIEKIIMTHPSVEECAVFGIPHPKWGETPVAHVKVNKNSQVDEEELLRWVNQRVPAKYQRLTDLKLVESFPRNTSGKILRRELRKQFQSF